MIVAALGKSLQIIITNRSQSGFLVVINFIAAESCPYGWTAWSACSATCGGTRTTNRVSEGKILPVIFDESFTEV